MAEKNNSGKKNRISYILAGIAGGFAALTCCIAPIVLVTLGFGTAFSMAIMDQFHVLSILSGIVLMFLITLYIVKRRSGVCNIRTVRKNWSGIFLAVAIMIAGWFVINYIIVEPIAANVYSNLPVSQRPLGNAKEMAEAHQMPDSRIEVAPENEGRKQITIKISGIYCGSCGPAIEYDIKSVSGVEAVSRWDNRITITYDSNMTSKDTILANVHDPYTADIISEKKL